MSIVAAALLAPLAQASPGAGAVLTGLDIVTAGSADAPEIWFSLTVREPIDARNTPIPAGAVELRDLRADTALAVLDVAFGDRTVDLIAADPEARIARMIFEKTIPLYLHAEAPIELMTASGVMLLLTVEELETLAVTRALGGDEFAAFLAVTEGRQYEFENEVHLDRMVAGADTAGTEYAVRYRLGGPVRGTPLSYRFVGHLSTDLKNPMNRAEFALRLRSGLRNAAWLPATTWSTYLDAGFAGDQRFEATRASLTLGVEALVPNFLDLTGGANRLRLFPVVGAWVSYRHDMEDLAAYPGQRDFLEAGAALSYTIPLLDKYTIFLESAGTFNDDREGRGWRHLTSATLAYDLPLEDLRVLARWESGSNEFTLKEDTRVLLGLFASALPRNR